MRLRLTCLSILTVLACSDNPASPVDGGVGSDAPRTDAAAVDGRAIDASNGAIVAVPGQRCEIGERIGVVRITRNGTTFSATADLREAPPPDVAAPTLSTASCEYYKFAPSSPCAPCEAGQVCDVTGSCVSRPMRLAEATLVVSGGGQEQMLVPMGDDHAIGATLTLPGESFSLVLDAYGQHITLVETTVPDALEGVVQTLSEDQGTPTALDVSWTVPEDGEVHTLIRINHHVFETTFTDCHVQASTGVMHIDGDMLVPLAVITGLEFQGVDHMRFAAADTPDGCVEFRYRRRTFPTL